MSRCLGLVMTSARDKKTDPSRELYNMPTVEPECPSASRGVQSYVPRPTSTATTATYDPTPIARPVHGCGDPESRRYLKSATKTATAPWSTASRPADGVSCGRQERLGQFNDKQQARSPRRVQKQTPRGSISSPQTSRQSTARRHSASPRDRRPATSSHGHGDRNPYKVSRNHRYGDQR